MTTDTRRSIRHSIADSLSDALRIRGYIATATGSGNSVNVGTPEGYLGTLRFWSIFTHHDGSPRGYVEFEPVVGNEGRYQVTNTGTINLSGLLKRLKAEVPKAAAYRERSRASRERDAADETVKDGLQVPEGVDVLVFDGKVDIKLVDISPALAKAVLDVVRGGL